MAGDKLPNGKMLATFGTLEFAVTDCAPPKYTKGEAPNTSTNSNTIFESFGKSERITIENMTMECAFKSDDYSTLPTIMLTRGALTLTDVEGTTYEFGDVEIMSYEGSGFTIDDFPKASVEFKIFTGDIGDTTPTITTGT